MIGIIPILETKMMEQAKIADTYKLHLDTAIADLSVAGASLDKLMRPLNNDDFIRMGKLALIVHHKSKIYKQAAQTCQDTRNMMIKACIHRDELHERLKSKKN